MKKTILKNLPLLLGVITIIISVIGFATDLKMSIVETIYSTFGFFGGNGSIENIQKSFLLKIAAVTAPLSVIILLSLVFLDNIKKWFFLTFISKNHFVICGLNDMGFTFANDLFSADRFKNEGYSKILIIESDELNPYIEELKLKGAIVIIGDALNEDVLTRAKIKDAKSVVCFYENDISNLEIAINLAKMDYKTPSYYIHLENRENYELLQNKVFDNINIKSFSSYDSAAQTLFMQYPLGENVNTLENGNKVRLALVGFGKVGEAILYRALNLGYFYNEELIQIDIFDSNIKDKEQEFFKTYPIDQNISKDYWEIQFKDEYEFYTQSLNYTQIIFCNQDASKSFQDAMKIIKNHTKEINQNNIQMYLYANSHSALSKILTNDDTKFNNLHTFGNFNELCTYDVIIAESLDEMAIASNNRYNELHNYSSAWHELNAFTKDSNRMQIEHLPIKFKIINHFLSLNEKQGEYETIKEEALKRWFVYGGKMIWDDMKDSEILATYLPLDVLDRLAQMEHKRWNAFHILNGWQKLTEPIADYKKLKLHPCLVKWEELSLVSEAKKHDYKSDDIETIMRVSDMVSNISNDKYMKTHIDEFKRLINNYK